MDSRLYLVLTLACYAVGALYVLLHALTRRRLLTHWTVMATLLGFAFHTASMSQRWIEAGHFPVIGLRDGTSFLAWTTVLVFLMTYVRTRVDALGLAVYPAAFGLVLVANLSRASGAGDPAAMHSVVLPIHATLAFFGYGALFVAFAMGVLYLVQERELRARAPRAFYYLIPSLERCDTISGHTVLIGFAFLTLAILTGLEVSHVARGRYWSWNPKELTALLAWGLYVLMITARWRAGWGGRRGAFLGIAAFVSVVAIFAYVTVLGGSARVAVVG